MNSPRPTVYIETTVIGHAVGRIRSDLVSAARQAITRDWWPTASDHFELRLSQLVVDECAAGDPEAAAERLTLLEGISLLQVPPEAGDLARLLVDRRAVPVSEPRDALHIATAAFHGVDFLTTWNFRHIANAVMMERIYEVCREGGYTSAAICTPEQLMKGSS